VKYWGKRYNRHNFFNGLDIGRSNVNKKALDVLYKTISHIIFQNSTFKLIFKLKLPATVL